MSMQTPNQPSEQPLPKSADSSLPQTYSGPTANDVTQAANGLPPTQPPPEQLVPTKYVVIGVITAVVISIVSIAFIMYMAANYAFEMAALRDIMIIALALESCIFGIALMILLVMVIRLVNMLEFEIKPILERTNETIGMVRGTTVFMGDNVVKPLTSASSYIAGIRKGIKTLFGNPKNNLK
ncbi:MAG: hypothetical protein GWP17_00765 [Aquificales bacterium]|nr:hypothetical protein [Aquificales bacterium]